MIFSDAKAVVVPFGKFAGKTIDQIGEADAGLLWLDWLRGQQVKSPLLRQALDVYLTDKTIAAEVERLVRR